MGRGGSVYACAPPYGGAVLIYEGPLIIEDETEWITVLEVGHEIVEKGFTSHIRGSPHICD
jgi:hypothetical protein